MVSIERTSQEFTTCETSDEAFLYAHLAPWAQDHADKSSGSIGVIPYDPVIYPFQRIADPYTPPARIKGESLVPNRLIRSRMESKYLSYFGDEKAARSLVGQIKTNAASPKDSRRLIDAIDEMTLENYKRIKRGEKPIKFATIAAHDILQDIVLGATALNLASRLPIDRDSNRAVLNYPLALESARNRKGSFTPVPQIVSQAVGIDWVLADTPSATRWNFDESRSDDPTVARLLRIRKIINGAGIRSIMTGARQGQRVHIAPTASRTSREYADMIGLPTISKASASLIGSFDRILPFAITREPDGRMGISVGHLTPAKDLSPPDIEDLLAAQLRNASGKCVYHLG